MPHLVATLDGLGDVEWAPNGTNLAVTSEEPRPYPGDPIFGHLWIVDPIAGGAREMDLGQPAGLPTGSISLVGSWSPDATYFDLGRTISCSQKVG